MLELIPMLKDLLKLPGLLKEIYTDLAKPGVSQVGMAIGTLIGLGNTILWPIALLNEKAKIALVKNLEKYREQLEKIPEDQILEVRPEIGVPILEKLAYVTNEELSDMYVNLLSKASTSNAVNHAHPSFVNVINNLSPDEAVLIKFIDDDIPFIEARYTKPLESKYLTAAPLLTGLETKANLLFPENIPAYLSNLKGLGIIDIRYDVFIADPTLYKKLEEQYRLLLNGKLTIPKNHELTFHGGKIELTLYGSLFIKACLTKLNKP